MDRYDKITLLVNRWLAQLALVTPEGLLKAHKVIASLPSVEIWRGVHGEGVPVGGG